MKITSNNKMMILRSLLTLCSAVFFLSASVAQKKPDSLDIKIGQMINVGFPSQDVDQSVLRAIREGKVGAVIFFEKNIPPINSYIAMKKMIWTYQQAASIPLLVSIDQEGGKVNRLKDKYGFPRSITAEAMGKSNSLDSVRFYAESTAATLAGMGFNVNFAPVVDLAVNPTNPVIVRHGRSFSNNEDSVIMLAKEFIIQHRKYNVLTAIKHFPGHGSSLGDSHMGLTDVTKTWSERELKPYQSLITDGFADAVMSAHIVHQTLDKQGRPGTLSAEILDGILRKRLNFDGVVFSDDMQMHAITKNYSLEESIKLAINAGIDVMTFSNNISGSDISTADKVHGIIRRMVETGEITQQRIDQSYRRIMKVKTRLQAGSRAAALQKEVSKMENENEALRNEVEKLTVMLKQKGEAPTDTKKSRRKKRKNT